MPYGIIKQPEKLTEEEQALKEEYTIKLYNLKKPHNKIIRANNGDKYLGYDAIDKFKKRYELKSVKTEYGKFPGVYFPIKKLGYCNEKGFRIIYHFSNDVLYYIDYSATAFKNRWFKNSCLSGMIYIPVDALKKC